MDAGTIRNKFADQLGPTRYAKFLRTLNLSARHKRRILFWQQKEWNTFCGNSLVDENLDVFEIFAVCDIHDRPLNQATNDCLIKNDFPEFHEILPERFPYISRKTTDLNCPDCNDAYRDWMTTKSTTTEPIQLLDVMTVHSKTVIACRMWPIDRQKLDRIDAITFETAGGSKRFRFDKYELPHASRSSNAEPRQMLIQLLLDDTEFDVPIGSSIRLDPQPNAV